MYDDKREMLFDGETGEYREDRLSTMSFRGSGEASNVAAAGTDDLVSLHVASAEQVRVYKQTWWATDESYLRVIASVQGTGQSTIDSHYLEAAGEDHHSGDFQAPHDAYQFPNTGSLIYRVDSEAGSIDATSVSVRGDKVSPLEPDTL